jgi:hypothetical protein
MVQLEDVVAVALVALVEVEIGGRVEMGAERTVNYNRQASAALLRQGRRMRASEGARDEREKRGLGRIIHAHDALWEELKPSEGSSWGASSWCGCRN